MHKYSELLADRREAAIEAGRAVEAAKSGGKKMREIGFLESQHAQAWSRFYAMEVIARQEA